MSSTLVRSLWLALFAILLSLVSVPPVVAEAPSPPPFYAIHDVRVVTGTGTVLDSATVLIADGLIEAVGTNLEIPADAWRVDGTGLTLYPGLFDGLTNLGQQSDEEGPGGSRSGSGGPTPPPIRGPEDRPATTPWQQAADKLGDDDRFAKWREAGFTTALSSPESGIFAGAPAVIHLGDVEPKFRVLASDVAQRVNFDGPWRGYPGSLMGVLAYVGQIFSDTRHYTEANKVYGPGGSGAERPTYDRALATLETALSERRPFLLPADAGREIDRALTMARRWQIRPIVYGAQGAYGQIETLARAKADVLVSLDWPEESSNHDPEADTPFRTLYHRELAPSTPARLTEAGIRFAFTSQGLSSPSDIFEGVRQAIEAGLSEEAALAALTSGPAKIFGVDQQVGTIERGKIANLLLASDAPWAEGVEISAVFVEGTKYQERKDTTPTEPPASDVSGTWDLVLVTPGGDKELTLEVEMTEDGKVTGEITSDRGTSTLEDGQMSAETLSFDTTRTMGTRTMESSFSLEIEETEATGTLSSGPRTMELSGSLQASEEGDSESAEEGSEEPKVSLAEWNEAHAIYQGPAQSLGDFAITNARVYTVSGETFENASVVVANGKIAAVGPQVTIPDGIEVYDAQGGSLIPGIIDAHSHIAADGGLNEGSIAVSAMVSAGDVLDPDDITIYHALAGGVTTVNVLHGSSNPIGGQNAIIKLRWGTDASGLVFQGAPAGIKFALGENPKRSRWTPRPGSTRRYPKTRMGVMDVIRQAFTDAQVYQAEWTAYRSQKGKKRGLAPRRDFKLDALVEILEGKRLVHSHSYRADEILQLIRLAEDFGFQIATLQHVLEGYKVADEIAAHGAGASTFSDWWGYKVEAFDAIPYNAALMTERGVVVSINSDSGEEMRHLNQEAAKTMKWGGLSENQALSLVTLNPARQLGIDNRVGSIEVGKDADLTLYDGPPLSVYSVVQKTFVDGDLYFDIEADRQRQAHIDELKSRLSPSDEEENEEDVEENEESEGEAEPPPEPESRTATGVDTLTEIAQ